MPQAKITLAGTLATGTPFGPTAGSQLNAKINSLVTCDNINTGGELSYTWSILDQPPGATDSLSSVAVQNPFFTPKKEGTYLLRLIVNQGLPTEQEDRVVLAIEQLKTLERIPAAGETTESDTSDGWAASMNSLLRRVDTLLSDPGILVGVNGSGGTLNRGQIVRSIATATLKATLPGVEVVPSFTSTNASTLVGVDEMLCIIEGTPGGASGVPGVGTPEQRLMKVRYIGRIASQVIAGPAVVPGDIIFVNDSGALSSTQGTIRRRVGSSMGTGSTVDVWFDGVGGADIDQTPIDRRYVIHGPLATVVNGVRVDGANATGIIGDPFRIKAGDAATVAFQVQRFLAGLDIQQWLDEAAVVLLSVSYTGSLKAGAGLPLRLMTGTTDKWQVATTGELQSVGGPRAIQSVLDPVTAQDAATKAYVDGKPVDNLVINGALDYWQRTPSWSMASIGPGVGFQTQRTYIADRWYGYLQHNSAVSSSSDFDLTQEATTVGGNTGAEDFNFSARVSRFNALAGTIGMVQEIDREQVINARGKRLALRVTVRKGSGFTGTLVARLSTGTSVAASIFRDPASVTATGYTGVTNLISGVDLTPSTSWETRVLLASAAVPLDANCMAVEFASGKSGANAGNDWFKVTGVMLWDVTEAVVPPAATPFRRAGGTLAGELLACQRYFEKSQPTITDIGTYSAGGIEVSLHSAAFNPVADGTIWPLGAHPRFKVTKRTAPTGLAKAVWDAYVGVREVYVIGTAAVAGTWRFGPPTNLNKGTLATTIADTGFLLKNNTGGVDNSVECYTEGHWAASAEI